jgi:rod shape-determining protein MreD
MQLVVRNIIWFIGLFALQILILKNAHLNAYTFPFVYPLLLLMLPRQTQRIVLIIVGFSIGIIFDMFHNTSGIHAFATTLIAYFRQFALEPLSPSDSASEEIEPSIYTMGFQKFFLYVLITLGAHHLIVFALEYFSWSDFGTIIISTVVSLSISIFLVFILQFIFIKRPK